MLSVILYTKENCGLCEEVKAELAALQATFPHQLTEVDITLDTAVNDKYKFVIPVIEINGTQLQSPINRRELFSALKTETADNKL